MPHEQVLIPNGPVFLVDRGWLKAGPKNTKAWSGNFRPQSLYGVAVKTTKTSAKVKGRIKAQKSVKQKPQQDKSNESRRSKVIPSAKSLVKKPQNDQEGDEPLTSKKELVSKRVFNLAFTNPDDWEVVAGFESYLNYYHDVMATMVYPMECFVQTGVNPIRSFWLPLASTDSLLLKTFILIAVMHRYLHDSRQLPDTLRPLMRSLLQGLNKRISMNDMSEATIGAVSCLALMENSIGNFPAAKVHIAGLTEMVRLRDWLPDIPGDQRMKIWKADIVFSMDTLTKPSLPKPKRDPDLPHSPIFCKSESPTEKLDMFISSNASAAIARSVWDLRKVCIAIESAWRNNTILDTDGFYEDMTCIQYDLLTMQTLTEVDEALRLAFLVFSKPFNRQKAYSAEASRMISQRMRDLLDQIPPGQLDFDLRFWIYYMAGMVSRNTSERHWFNKELEALRKLHVLRNWGETKVKLQRVMWTSALHDTFGKELWDDLAYDVLLCSLSKV